MSRLCTGSEKKSLLALISDILPMSKGLFFVIWRFPPLSLIIFFASFFSSVSQGQLLHGLEAHEKASRAFCTSVTESPNLANAWLAWGEFCDSHFRNQPEESSSPTPSVTPSSGPSTSSSPFGSSMKGGSGSSAGGGGEEGQQRASWLHDTLTSYLQAMCCNSKSVHKVMPRVLWLLRFENQLDRLQHIFVARSREEGPPTSNTPQGGVATGSGGGLSASDSGGAERRGLATGVFLRSRVAMRNAKTLLDDVDEFVRNVPAWACARYLPSIFSLLLTCAQSPMGPRLKNLLLKVAKAFPSALYYRLREFISHLDNYFEEWKQETMAMGGNGSGSSNPPDSPLQSSSSQRGQKEGVMMGVTPHSQYRSAFRFVFCFFFQFIIDTISYFSF